MSQGLLRHARQIPGSSAGFGFVRLLDRPPCRPKPGSVIGSDRQRSINHGAVVSCEVHEIVGLRASAAAERGGWRDRGRKGAERIRVVRGAGARAAGRGSVLPRWSHEELGRVGVRLSGLMRQPDAYLRHPCATIGHRTGVSGSGGSTSYRRRSSRDQVATRIPGDVRFKAASPPTRRHSNNRF